jgi:hypothetical protein
MGPLRSLILARPRNSLYAVLDAAVLDGLLVSLNELDRRQSFCLLRGEIPPDVAHVAPYLCCLKEEAALVEWLEARLGLAWGYVLESGLSPHQLHLHLRRFTETRGPQGEAWLFRFWDPRVLRSMPDILKREQAQSFMQEITCLYLLTPGATEKLEWDASTAALRLSGITPMEEALGAKEASEGAAKGVIEGAIRGATHVPV